MRDPTERGTHSAAHERGPIPSFVRQSLDTLLGPSSQVSLLLTARTARIDAPAVGTCFVKWLSPRLAQEGEAREALAREATILDRLGGLGGVTPRLLGFDATASVLAATWVEGTPLERLMSTPTSNAEHGRAGNGDRAQADAAPPLRSLLRAALHALASLHAAPPRLVHGDINPGNVLVDHRLAGSAAGARTAKATRVAFVDFELSSSGEGPARAGPPRDGAFRGTLPYAAPEVAGGALPSIESDVFALGAVLYEFATGERLRTQQGPALLLEAAEAAPTLTRLDTLGAEGDILREMLRFERNARADAASLVARLDELAEGR